MSAGSGGDPHQWQSVSLNGDHPYSFEAQIEREPERTVVAPTGELDIATCEALERRIAPLVTGEANEDSGGHIVVDLSGLVFIDVAGMRALLRCARLAEERGIRLSIALGSDRVRRLFELCRMVDEFPFVYESLAAVPR
jgi:anti-anti-sigma factor